MAILNDAAALCPASEHDRQPVAHPDAPTRWGTNLLKIKSSCRIVDIFEGVVYIGRNGYPHRGGYGITRQSVS